MKIRFKNRIIPPDRLRLTASIASNLIAKLPGIAGVLLILPLISVSIGVHQYGRLLSMLALGSSFTFVFGGINAYGRRELAFAHASGLRGKEANIFLTVLACSGAAAVLMVCVVLYLATYSTSDNVAVLIALFPIVAAVLNTFDNLRAAYNEHYITASLQFIFQVGVYGAALLFGVFGNGLIIPAFILLAPSAIASLVTGSILILEKPYLLHGHLAGARKIVMASSAVALADGAILAALNMTVYWLGTVGSAEEVASFGTLVRLFQTLSSPVLLIMLPLSGFISLHWGTMLEQRRIYVTNWFLVIGLTYGLVVSAVLTLGGHYYITRFIGASTSGDAWEFIAIGIFGGSITAYKAISLLAYSVKDARLLSVGIATSTLIAALVAALTKNRLMPLHVVDVFCIFAALSIFVWLVVESKLVGRLRRGSQ